MKIFYVELGDVFKLKGRWEFYKCLIMFFLLLFLLMEVFFFGIIFWMFLVLMWLNIEDFIVLFVRGLLLLFKDIVCFLIRINYDLWLGEMFW